MAKFKVGDKVIGNSENRYSYTKKGWIGIVKKLVERGDKDIIVGTTNGTSFPVHSQYFDLVRSNTIVEETSDYLIF